MYKAVNLIFVIFLSNILIAQSKGELLQSDESQKKWVRKAVIGVEPVFVPEREISAPVKICEDKECRPAGTFKYTLSQEDISQMSYYIYDWLITSRYDRITVGSGTSVITTKTDQIAVALPRILAFKSKDIESFNEDLEKYSLIMQRILNRTINERYLELSEKEQETFIVTKAKETGLAKEFITVLMNSAFLFAVEIKSISADGTIRKVDIKDPQGNVIKSGYNTSFQIDMKADVIVYKYDYDEKEFSPYKTIKARSGGFLLNMMGLGAGAFDAKMFPSPPGVNSKAMISVWKNSLNSAIKALGISGNYELKKDDNFAIFAPVKEVDGSNIHAACGVSEDIRVDHPMVIQEYRDGEVNVTGYAKARKIGKNCLDPLNATRFRKIKGSAEEGDQLREHPWTGLMFSFGGGIRDFGFSFIEDMKRVSLGGIMGGGQIGISMDLGYATNLRFLSETWLYLGGYFYAGGTWNPKKYGVPLTGGFHFNLSHRIHFTGGGAFFAPQFSLLYTGGASKAASQNINKGDLSFGALSIEPGLQIGFSFTPNFEMIFYGGYQVPVYSELKKNEKDITGSSRAVFNHGFVASLNFQVHLPVVGATAAIYSNPSKECRKKDKGKKVTEEENSHPERPMPGVSRQDRSRDKGGVNIDNISKGKSDIKTVPRFDKSVVEGIDLLEVDPDVMMIYDEAVKIEMKRDIIQYPEMAIDAWKKLVKVRDKNPFLKIGRDRLKIWNEYNNSIHETEERHSKAREMIKRILPLDSISFEQKRDATLRYIETYCVDEGMQEILDILTETAATDVAEKIISDENIRKASRNVVKTRCEKGNGQECFVFSSLFKVGSDEEREYIEKACSYKHDEACEKLNMIKEIERQYQEKVEKQRRMEEAERNRRIEEEKKRKRMAAERKRIREQKEKERLVAEQKRIEEEEREAERIREEEEEIERKKEEEKKILNKKIKEELSVAGKKRVLLAVSSILGGVAFGVTGGILFSQAKVAEKNKDISYVKYLQTQDSERAEKYRNEVVTLNKQKNILNTFGGISIGLGVAFLTTGIVLFAVDNNAEKEIKRKYNLSINVNPFNSSIGLTLLY